MERRLVARESYLLFLTVDSKGSREYSLITGGPLCPIAVGV